jgi:hypothetical protein
MEELLDDSQILRAVRMSLRARIRRKERSSTSHLLFERGVIVASVPYHLTD